MKKINRLLFTLVLLFPIFSAVADNDVEPSFSTFKVTITRTVDGIQMKSLGRTAWTNLKFKVNDSKSQQIDEYGMVEKDKIENIKDCKLTDFSFYLTLNSDLIELKSIRGANWNSLSFTLRVGESKIIDDRGMVN